MNTRQRDTLVIRIEPWQQRVRAELRRKLDREVFDLYVIRCEQQASSPQIHRMLSRLYKMQWEPCPTQKTIYRIIGRIDALIVKLSSKPR